MPAHHYTYFLVTLTLMGCDINLNNQARVQLQEMALTSDTPLPESPTNKYADDLNAADFGRLIFYDKRMSRDESTACGSCHIPTQGWSDDREVSEGVDSAEGGRHSMPSHTIAFQDYFFWDGRADSAWSQTLQAIESSAEMDFPREDVAQYVFDERKRQYETIFGAIPDDFQSNPDAINRIFSNVGKALETYQRRVVCADTQFDRWAMGEVEMTPEQETGAAAFVRGGCVDCHSGIAFSNGLFHELGVPSQFDGDNGREDGLRELLDNPFNGAGVYSDDREFGTEKLRDAMQETRVRNAYKTPSLRGVAQRGRFGHDGRESSLEEFIDDTYDDRNARGLDPKLRGVNVGREDQLISFLEMLNCPDVDPRWAPPTEFSP